MAEQWDRSKRWNDRRRKDDRNRRILELYKAGANCSEIARTLEANGDKITRFRVSQVVKQELAHVADERRHIALEVFDLELERLSAIIRQSWQIVMAPCRGCDGQGTFQNGESCDVCRGDGKGNHPDTRVRAMKEVRAAIDQRAKMLGMYAPEKFAVTDTEGNDIDFSRALRSLEGDDLDRELQDVMRGVEIARSLATDGN